MPTSANYKKRKEEKIKHEILEAARKVFELKELMDITVGDISEMAVVSRTTIYKYFPHGRDEIYFVLGALGFATANEILKKTILNSNKTGLEQFLGLCEFTFDRATPFIFTILTEFYNRVNIKNLKIEEMHDEIARKARTDEYEDIRNQFDEPYIVDFYVEIQQTAFLWENAIEKGQKDGSILKNLDKSQIIHFINLSISGIIEQTLLRKGSTLKRIGLEQDVVKKQTLDIIRLFLQSP